MYSQIARNKRLSIIFVILFVVIIGGLGYLIAEAFGQPSYAYIILVASLSYAVISYFASARIAIAMSGAREVQKSDAPELYRVVENLSIASGLPMPKVYTIDDPAPNAFATGRDPQHAIVAVTSGLLNIMDKPELEGVLAHELSHVGNYDIRFMAVVVALVAVVSVISDLFLRLSFWSSFGDEDEGNNGNQLFMILAIVGAILAPLIALVVQLAVSRQREYLADSSGALLTRYPDGLASALAKIGTYNKPMQKASSATAHLYISNPLKGRSLGGLFDTHPPIEERIKRLQAMDTKA
ncbi:M48 family metalloprotease [Candidatus Saccharibacteria bacterium]|nr:M48 family metalloprotease [Candidatus Saccharibacteria bacterium]